MRIVLQPAFILHHRHYRETSLLLDVFTQEHGRINLIARGVRKPNPRSRSLLQPFTPLLISWQGKTELMTLSIAEPQGSSIRLSGECLLSAFYLNELLVKLLQKHDPYPQLYTIYADTLLKLAQPELKEGCYASLKKSYWKSWVMGCSYNMILSQVCLLLSKRNIVFILNKVLGCAAQFRKKLKQWFFSGKSLLAFAAENLIDADDLRDAKRLMRIVLSGLLGTQQLHSRKLFIEVAK